MVEPSAHLAAEAARLHRRYLLEIVEALGFCPWAKRARIDGRVRQHVSMADTDEAAIGETQQSISRWTLEPDVEVAFMIFPRLAITRPSFDALSTKVGEREVSRHPVGQTPFVMAAFHPEARVDTNTGERFIPFLRRTPDPCLQLVRVSVLDAVRANTPQGTRLADLDQLMKLGPKFLATMREEMPLRERIAKQNLETARKLGVDELARKLDEIQADRNRTYAELERGQLAATTGS